MNAMRMTLVAVAVTLTSSAVIGCASTSACTPGRVETCPCLGGGAGVQTCTTAGTFGACECAATDAGVDAASAQDSGRDGGPVESDAGPGDDASLDDADTDAGPVDLTGHIVLMGNYPHGFADDAMDTILGSTVLLSERSGELRVLEYVQYSEGFDRTRIRTMIQSRAAAAGRTTTHRELTNAFSLGAEIADTDVLMVYAQITAEPEVMQAIADGWHDLLVDFVDDGGVVVVMAPDVGTMPGANGAEARIVSGTGLLSIPIINAMPLMDRRLEVSAVDSPLVTGVVSPFEPTNNNTRCFPSSAGGTVVVRRAPDLCPVVRHLAR